MISIKIYLSLEHSFHNLPTSVCVCVVLSCPPVCFHTLACWWVEPCHTWLPLPNPLKPPDNAFINCFDGLERFCYKTRGKRSVQNKDRNLLDSYRFTEYVSFSEKKEHDPVDWIRWRRGYIFFRFLVSDIRLYKLVTQHRTKFGYKSKPICLYIYKYKWILYNLKIYINKILNKMNVIFL